MVIPVLSTEPGSRLSMTSMLRWAVTLALHLDGGAALTDCPGSTVHGYVGEVRIKPYGLGSSQVVPQRETEAWCA